MNKTEAPSLVCPFSGLPPELSEHKKEDLDKALIEIQTSWDNEFVLSSGVLFSNGETICHHRGALPEFQALVHDLFLRKDGWSLGLYVTLTESPCLSSADERTQNHILLFSEKGAFGIARCVLKIASGPTPSIILKKVHLNISLGFFKEGQTPILDKKVIEKDIFVTSLLFQVLCRVPEQVVKKIQSFESHWNFQEAETALNSLLSSLKQTPVVVPIVPSDEQPKKKHTQMVELLIEAIEKDDFVTFYKYHHCLPNLNTQNSEGKTILHYSLRKGFRLLSQALIRKGANPRLPDFSGITPLDEAMRNNHSEIVQREDLLQEKKKRERETENEGEEDEEENKQLHLSKAPLTESEAMISSLKKLSSPSSWNAAVHHLKSSITPHRQETELRTLDYFSLLPDEIIRLIFFHAGCSLYMPALLTSKRFNRIMKDLYFSLHNFLTEYGL